MRTASIAIGLCAAIVGAASNRSYAQSPGTAFTYQGRLSAAGGPANGLHDMRFTLWSSASDPDAMFGAPVCIDGVAVSSGLFTTQIDFGSNVFVGLPLWLGIEVRADATPGNCASGAFTTLSPRQSLTPTPYAVYATTAGTSGLRLPFKGNANLALEALLDLENTRTAGDAYAGIFRVRSTVANSTAVTGLATGASGSTYGVYGKSVSSSGTGVYGESSGYAGVRGVNSNVQGKAVVGDATALTGFTYGVHGYSYSSDGIGVYGQTNGAIGVKGYTSGPQGMGMFGVATNLTGVTYGVYGEAYSSNGIGVYGQSPGLAGVKGMTNGYQANGVVGVSSSAASFGAGVLGQSDNTTSSGVYGLATSATNNTQGVLGRSVSTSGDGVVGIATAHTGTTYGGRFVTQSTSGYGVSGSAIADTGVSYGVYGRSDSPSGWGVWSLGRSGASGTKSFRIDHPDDPENKYLLHYAAESLEVLNLYSGKVTLDAAGEAMVMLPTYFGKINRDPRYLLTPVGAAMPNLHIAEEISEMSLRAGEATGPAVTAPLCSFRIAGGVPRAKVCWEVKALRNDLYVQNRGAPVEEEKQLNERGTYQHPEFYGQPPEKAMNYQAERLARDSTAP